MVTFNLDFDQRLPLSSTPLRASLSTKGLADEMPRVLGGKGICPPSQWFPWNTAKLFADGADEVPSLLSQVYGFMVLDDWKAN